MLFSPESVWYERMLTATARSGVHPSAFFSMHFKNIHNVDGGIISECSLCVNFNLRFAKLGDHYLIDHVGMHDWLPLSDWQCQT